MEGACQVSAEELLDVQHMKHCPRNSVRGQEGKVSPHHWSGPASLSLPPGGILHSCPTNPESIVLMATVQTQRGATSGFSGAAAVWGHPLSAPHPDLHSLGTSDMGFYDHKLWIARYF